MKRMKNANFREIDLNAFPDCCYVCKHMEFGCCLEDDWRCKFIDEELKEAKLLDEENEDEEETNFMSVVDEHEGMYIQVYTLCDNFERSIYEEVQTDK
ncbi:hypothetical protein M0R19_05840 [Candidatus Pacearchaeota archaeon]|jgi:hypothetical protein|nr:hypothetical protein [Candidatus Pacearchaeota archaeon]